VALLNLAFVTATLVKLVEESIKASGLMPAGQTADVSNLPPDLLAGDNALGIYLYHLCEDAAYKNQTWPGRPQPPMRFTPMGLNLYYVVSARSALSAALGPAREQLLMSVAVKALHDWPRIDAATTVNGVSILHGSIKDTDNPLKIELRHVPPNEAVSYWTAGSNPLRLSAYYEVRVVLLEPDEPTTGGGRVLSYGIQTFLGGQPRLEASRSTVRFRVPGESADRVVEAQPAIAFPAIAGQQGTEVAFVGLNLTGGSVSLWIRARSWDDAVALDSSWGVVAGVDRIFATTRTSAAGRAVLPGPYTASARITKTFSPPGGSTKVIEQVSNEIPFTIVPAVHSFSAVAGGVFTVTGGPFQHVDLDPKTVHAYIGGTQLVVGPAGALPPGRFAVTGPTTIEMRFPVDVVAGTFVPVRIVINGAESAPNWIQVA
jgi:hypothetical protein